MIKGSFSEIRIVKELSAVFLDSVANPVGGVVVPIDVKFAVTDAV